MIDPIAILRARAADLRFVAMSIEAAINDIQRQSANGDTRSLVGIGMSDHCMTIQGGDIDVDGDGFALMRPDDDDPESGMHP